MVSENSKQINLMMILLLMIIFFEEIDGFPLNFYGKFGLKSATNPSNANDLSNVLGIGFDYINHNGKPCCECGCAFESWMSGFSVGYAMGSSLPFPGFGGFGCHHPKPTFAIDMSSGTSLGFRALKEFIAKRKIDNNNRKFNDIDSNSELYDSSSDNDLPTETDGSSIDSNHK